jgi:iron complex outermembrane recepter protein
MAVLRSMPPVFGCTIIINWFLGKLRRSLLAGAAVLSIAATPVPAQDGDDDDPSSKEENSKPVVVPQNDGAIQLGTVTVTARRVETPISNIPGSVSVVDGEVLDEQVTIARDARQILNRTVPGFRDFHNGSGPVLRGRTALVLINGVPVNEFLRAGGGIDVTALEPEAIGRIEVARGASAAYGFGAPGGIVSLETRRARTQELTLGSRISASTNPHRTGASNEYTAYQSIEGGADGPFDYYLGALVADEGLEFAPNDDPVAFTEEGLAYNVDGSFGLQLGDGRALRLTGFYHRENIDEIFHDVDFDGDIERNDNPDLDDSYRENYSVNLSYQQNDLFGSALKIEAFRYELTDEKIGLIIPGTIDIEENEYWGVRSNLTTPLDFITDRVSVTYGFDFVSNRLFRPFSDQFTGEAFEPFAPDVTQDSYAGFFQLDVPVGDFLFSGGVRHEEFRPSVEESAFIEGGDIPDFSETLFNAGLVYFLTDYTELFAGFSQGIEITQLGRAGRDAILRAVEMGRRARPDEINPEPAKSDSYEIGARGDWGDTRADFALFYTDSDLSSSTQIDPDNPLTGPLIPLREPREIWGVEATLDHRFSSQWGVGGLLSYQEGERELPTGEERDISSTDIQPVQVTAYVDYAPTNWWRNSLQVTYTHERDPFDEASVEFGEGNVGSIFLMDYFAAFDILGGELSLGIENLLNKEYISIQDQASNVEAFSTPDFVLAVFPQEGRRVTLTYTLTW